MKQRALLAGTLLSTGLGACASCSTPAPPDASADAATDVRQRDAADASGTLCDASFSDGGLISDWPGFRRLTEMSPCCVADVALDAAAAPTLTWIPCANGAPSCVQVKRTWAIENPSALFGVGKVSHDAKGAPLLLPLGFPISGTSGIAAFYSLPSLLPVAVFQSDNGNTSPPSARCPFSELAAQSNIAIVARTGAAGAIVATTGAPNAFGPAVVFDSIAPPGAVPGFQTSAASGSRLAFDVPTYGWIEQWPFDGGAVVQSTNTTGAALLLDFVEGDDVFAWSEHGTSGWSEEYRVAADGTVVPYRSKANTHVTAMASDGTNVTWCESYGASSSSQLQPNVEVWTAPYSGDPATLAATAKKIATLPFAATCGSATSFGGYYAVTTVPFFTAEIVRLSDGAMQAVNAGPGWGFSTFALVSATELWSTMNEETDAGTLGIGGVAFARYALGAWP